MASFLEWARHALQATLGHRWLLPLTALLLRAGTVRPSGPFVIRELLHRKHLCVYRLAGSGLAVAIRHSTGDVVTLGEIFHDNDYAPIRELGDALREIHEIVDLGANIGLFGAFAATRWPHAHITAFEPDPGNAATHERMLAVNGLAHRWTLVRAAAGTRDGETQFTAGKAALSRLADAGDEDTIAVAVRDVLPTIGAADLLKMDIEGGEWAILSDPRFRQTPPRVAVLEYHPYRCPGNDAHSAAETALRAADMRVRTVERRSDGHGMLWAWRT